jgi:hypothetical protein
MKMEKLEGTGNIRTESTENVSSGAIGGEISEKVLSTQKRTRACLNISQDSGNKASTQKKPPNIAQAGSIGVAKGVANDSKQAHTQ